MPDTIPLADLLAVQATIAEYLAYCIRALPETHEPLTRAEVGGKITAYTDVLSLLNGLSQDSRTLS